VDLHAQTLLDPSTCRTHSVLPLLSGTLILQNRSYLVAGKTLALTSLCRYNLTTKKH
jgi:hypothetical protein